MQQSSYEEQIDPMAMAESVEEATYMINSSQMPVIIAGVEIQPFALQSQVLKLIEKTCIPVVATILSKSVISEDHPS